MTNEEIKFETELAYAKIKNAEERLVELREICTHENVIQSNYSWRVGSMQLADVCEYCGKLIRYIDYY